jgi:hypothetical protein
MKRLDQFQQFFAVYAGTVQKAKAMVGWGRSPKPPG